MPAKSWAPVCSMRGRRAGPRARRRADGGAESEAEALVAEADAEQGLLAAVDSFGADAEIARVGGVTRTGRKDDVVEAELGQPLPPRLVVADHERLTAVH